MAFRLKAGRSVSSEIRRIVLHQLDIATSELTSVGDPESDDAVHDARRRVKKIRAVIRLVRPVLDKTYRALDPELRRVHRMLAPVADGQGVLATLNQLTERYKTLPRATIEALRSDLLARERRIDAQAQADHVLDKASATLLANRAEVERWQLRAEGFSAIAPGLKECVRRARHAMALAWMHPTAAHHHAWRRHVKAHWFHTRLLEGQCSDHLMPLQRRLEALDGILGEYHNLVLLREVLVDDSHLPRLDVARCLRVLANYQRALRRHSHILGIRIYSEKPRHFVRRVKRFWEATAAPRIVALLLAIAPAAAFAQQRSPAAPTPLTTATVLQLAPLGSCVTAPLRAPTDVGATRRHYSLWNRLTEKGTRLHLGPVPVVGGLLPTPNIAAQGGAIDETVAAAGWRSVAPLGATLLPPLAARPIGWVRPRDECRP